MKNGNGKRKRKLPKRNRNFTSASQQTHQAGLTALKSKSHHWAAERQEEKETSTCILGDPALVPASRVLPSLYHVSCIPLTAQRQYSLDNALGEGSKRTELAIQEQS